VTKHRKKFAIRAPPDPCSPVANLPIPTPFFGDGSAGHDWNGTLGPGKSATFTGEYKRVFNYGDARQDLWIIQDLAQRMGEKWNYKHVSEVFEEMARLMPALDNITWDRVEREDHVTYPVDGPDVPGRDVVFDKGFPRPNSMAKLVAAKLTPPNETPDADFPFILTTGRQLEHWHTGAMTRRASVLDSLEPSASASVSRGTLVKLGLKPGDMLRVTTRRGTVELASRQDDGIPDGVIFIPFAFVEAAANILTNPALDPFGKIPEFKFCAAKVEPAKPQMEAAE
jgi:formate dehydrogenase major subunit